MGVIDLDRLSVEQKAILSKLLKVSDNLRYFVNHGADHGPLLAHSQLLAQVLDELGKVSQK